MSDQIHSSEKTASLQFTQQRGFRQTLNERVNIFLRDNHLPARDVPAMYLKTAIVLAWWLATYLLLLFGNFSTPINFVLCMVWAMAIAAVGFNVMHDANHNAYSNHPWLNRLLSLSAEMLGMSGFRWRTKHNVWHHTYTNIANFDDDVETYGTMRLTPRVPRKPLHQFQMIYFPLIYSFIGIDFVLRDFMMALIGKSDANHVYPKMKLSDQIIFWLGKIFFVVIMFVLPSQVYPWYQVVIGFAIVMLAVGLILGVIFQLAHISDQAEFPEPIGAPPHIENEWAIHQVQTTVDFAPNNAWLSWYIGGLNFQIEHHLLPHICHLNYPRLAPIVRATCEEFGIRYACHSTWHDAFSSHVRELSLLGQTT